MALLDDAVGGWGGGLAIGVGLALAAPVVVSIGRWIVVPVAKTAIRGALAVGDTVRELAAGASEHVSDLVAEVAAERHAATSPRRSRPTPVH